MRDQNRAQVTEDVFEISGILEMQTDATIQEVVKSYLLALTDLNKISCFPKKTKEDKQMGKRKIYCYDALIHRNT